MRIRSFAIFVVVLLAAGIASSQSQAPAKAPAPARGMADEIIASWNDVGRKVIAMAEDWPEDKYEYKPNPEVRSFAGQVLHVAGGNYLFIKAVRGEKWGMEDGDPPRDKYKTKAQVVAFLKQSFADVTALIKQEGDAGLAKTMKYPFGNRMILRSLFWMDVLGHGSEHYGQLVVYYRTNNMVPPESRR